jgi:hypothetical protein
MFVRYCLYMGPNMGVIGKGMNSKPNTYSGLFEAVSLAKPWRAMIIIDIKSPLWIYALEPGRKSLRDGD